MTAVTDRVYDSENRAGKACLPGSVLLEKESSLRFEDGMVGEIAAYA